MSIVVYAPDDLTVSMTADTTLAELQQHLAERKQWLPIDPPHPERTTVGQIVDLNLSGPRRYGYGTIREHVLSIRAELADGTLIKSGANVVKNAAGYDLCRLFTGARGELATIREITFKVQPLPVAEQIVETTFPTIEEACAFVEKIDTSELTPVVLDLHNIAGGGKWTVVIGFAGIEEDVDWQRKQVEQLAPVTNANLSYDQQFWSANAEAPIRKLSILPSLLAETIKKLGTSLPIVARAGNGIIYYRGGQEPATPELPVKLLQRLKNEFDPTNKLATRKV